MFPGPNETLARPPELFLSTQVYLYVIDYSNFTIVFACCTADGKTPTYMASPLQFPTPELCLPG
jgi:hypothetical protein